MKRPSAATDSEIVGQLVYEQSAAPQRKRKRAKEQVPDKPSEQSSGKQKKSGKAAGSGSTDQPGGKKPRSRPKPKNEEVQAGVPEETDNQKKESADEHENATFARRYRPKGHTLQKWLGLRSAFNSHVSPLLATPSKYEDWVNRDSLLDQFFWQEIPGSTKDRLCVVSSKTKNT